MNFAKNFAFMAAVFSLNAGAQILCIDKTPNLDMIHSRDTIYVEVYKNKSDLNRGKVSIKSELARVEGGLDGAYNEFTFESPTKKTVANFKVPREANVAFPTIVELNGSSFTLTLDYKSSIVLDMDCFSMKKK